MLLSSSASFQCLCKFINSRKVAFLKHVCVVRKFSFPFFCSPARESQQKFLALVARQKQIGWIPLKLSSGSSRNFSHAEQKKQARSRNELCFNATMSRCFWEGCEAGKLLWSFFSICHDDFLIDSNQLWGTSNEGIFIEMETDFHHPVFSDFPFPSSQLFSLLYASIGFDWIGRRTKGEITTNKVE